MVEFKFYRGQLDDHTWVGGWVWLPAVPPGQSTLWASVATSRSLHQLCRNMDIIALCHCLCRNIKFITPDKMPRRDEFRHSWHMTLFFWFLDLSALGSHLVAFSAHRARSATGCKLWGGAGPPSLRARPAFAVFSHRHHLPPPNTSHPSPTRPNLAGSAALGQAVVCTFSTSKATYWMRRKRMKIKTSPQKTASPSQYL